MKLDKPDRIHAAILGLMLLTPFVLYGLSYVLSKDTISLIIQFIGKFCFLVSIPIWLTLALLLLVAAVKGEWWSPSKLFKYIKNKTSNSRN